MPKMKTKKSVLKRFKVTARGKIRRHKAGLGHLLAKKRPKRKRRLKRATTVADADKRRIEALMAKH